jgi:hypothetical protein
MVPIRRIAVLAALGLCAAAAGAQTPPNPILFVTQTPDWQDFTTVASVFGNHLGEPSSAARGGDLYILYPGGTLRNLTREGGFGTVPGQEIAVREPCVHWDGQRALFSMVIGGTTQDDSSPVYWQIYEVRGLGLGQPVQITRVPNQPPEYNNVSPIYGTDGRILFTSDRPRNGERRLYPQLDEYESAPTNTGIWSLDSSVSGGDLRLLTHAVSGAFSPIIASDGRLLFVRWDHLQRDQQADADAEAEAQGEDPPYDSFDFVSEDSNQPALVRQEIFPEPREGTAPIHGLRFNQFFPWQILEDGSGEETLNHVGRHELAGYFDSSRDGLPEFIAPENDPRLRNDSFLGLREDPTRPGRVYGVNAPEFSTHASGQIVYLEAAESVNADDMRAQYVTHPATAGYVEQGDPVPPGHTGLYRNPLPLSNGALIAAHSPGALDEAPRSEPLGSDRFAFRLRFLTPPSQQGGYFTPGALLTGGIQRDISYFDNQPYQQVSYSGLMWELDPVEVVARPKPTTRPAPIPEIEKAVLDRELAGRGGIPALRNWLRARDLALVVSRNVTRRADRQQPYNLAVPGGTSTAEPGASPLEVRWVQFVQGDQVRGYGDGEGRRVVARLLHDAAGSPGAPDGSFTIAPDGSFAALVPARRALSWSLTAPDGSPVVRERYWITFQPGEIRGCPNCHGVNRTDIVLGLPAPENEPQALAPLLASIPLSPSPVPAGASAGIAAAGLLAAGLALRRRFQSTSRQIRR